jgi:chloramphenicol 3-O phosphotransferase
MKYKQEQVGKCIYLNGPTSAGKTSIAQELQILLEELYLHVQMDAFISMLPSHYLGSSEIAKQGVYWKKAYNTEGQEIVEIELGPIAKRLRQSMYDCWVTLLNSGHNLILDDVNFDKEEVDTLKQLLRDYHPTFIGVKCDLAELERRERQRGDRDLFTARAQYPVVHRNVIYDYEIDTTSLSAIECSKQIKSYLNTRLSAQ